MKKALVTGAAGFIGSHVVHQLTEMGAQVRATALPREPTSNIEKYKVVIVRGDMLDLQLQLSALYFIEVSQATGSPWVCSKQVRPDRC